MCKPRGSYLSALGNLQFGVKQVNPDVLICQQREWMDGVRGLNLD